jgi:hypothetical protein
VRSLSFVALTLLFGGHLAMGEDASVHLHVVDPFGVPIAYRVTSFVERSSGRDLKTAFRGLEASSIPYGVYRCTLARAGIKEKGEFGALSQEVWINRPEFSETLVTSGIVAIIEGHEASLDFGSSAATDIVRGSVSPMPEDPGPTWVRLQAPFTNWNIEAPVHRSGDFDVYSGLSGQYLVMVIHRGKIIHVEARVFRPSGNPTSIRIQLAPRAENE